MASLVPVSQCDHELRGGDRRASVVECGGAPPLFHSPGARPKRSRSRRNQPHSLGGRKSAAAAAAAAHSKTWRKSGSWRALFRFLRMHWDHEPSTERSADSLVRESWKFGSRGHGCPRSWQWFMESLQWFIDRSGHYL